MIAESIVWLGCVARALFPAKGRTKSSRSIFVMWGQPARLSSRAELDSSIEEFAPDEYVRGYVSCFSSTFTYVVAFSPPAPKA